MTRPPTPDGDRTPAAESARAEALPPQPTYANSVARILDTHCTSCQARGGIGPMPLTSFSDAHDDASPIAKQTRSRDMPPWLPDTKACAPLGNDDEMCLAFLYATPSL